MFLNHFEIYCTLSYPSSHHMKVIYLILPDWRMLSDDSVVIYFFHCTDIFHGWIASLKLFTWPPVNGMQSAVFILCQVEFYRHVK
jgi:hypothetical protein